MAKAKKNIKRKRSASQKSDNKWIEFFKSERLHFLVGVLIAFVGIFIFLSIVSFFFTGAADQSKVLNRSFVELVNDKDLQIENWTGVGGAFVAERLVNGGFGIFSILIAFFFVYVGLLLMKVSNFSFFKALLVTALGLIGGSIACAFVLNKLFPKFKQTFSKKPCQLGRQSWRQDRAVVGKQYRMARGDFGDWFVFYRFLGSCSQKFGSCHSSNVGL